MWWIHALKVHTQKEPECESGTAGNAGKHGAVNDDEPGAGNGSRILISDVKTLRETLLFSPSKNELKRPKKHQQSIYSADNAQDESEQGISTSEEADQDQDSYTNVVNISKSKCKIWGCLLTTFMLK